MIQSAPATERSTADSIRPMCPYDRHADVQRQSAGELLQLTLPFEPERIVEPGCGTGIYTRLLLDTFPRAELRGLDIHPEMLHIARAKFGGEATFRHIDAEEYDEAPVDLISSNATFQWFHDLPGTIRRYAELLRPGGRLTFSFYGPETYRELDAALREASEGTRRVVAADFARPHELRQALGEAFPRWSVQERRYIRTFPSLPALLRNIRHTGIHNPHRRRKAWNPGLISDVRRIYRDNCGAIRATYQVFFCRGDR
ncbi:MAG: methyltransferase domain-containing protein [Planctomycetota bacterium]